jgi:Zn finger protein HypA/HybF involved in hydrogenase expression
MYELSVAQELYCKSRTRVDELGAVELESVRVALGELSGITPELLRAAWKFVTSESADENCRIEIELRAARLVCPKCGAVPEAHPPAGYCERCKCHMRVESGAGIELLGVRFQEELALS